MISNDTQILSVALQTSLRRQSPSIRLSRSALLAESGFIVPVTLHLRTACLLSSLTATHQVLAALQDALVCVNGIIITVHEPSQQIFIINRELFTKRWCETSRRNLFYAIDADDREEQKRVQTSMPHKLTMLLTELYEKLESLKTAKSTEVIVLKSVDGSINGIALAGWLLEYDVIYFKNDQEKGPTMNNLAGVPLILIIVKLDNQTLYQYTFPLSMANAVYSSMTIKEPNLQEVCQSIKKRLVQRGRQAAELDYTFEVTYQQVTMDRVAI